MLACLILILIDYVTYGLAFIDRIVFLVEVVAWTEKKSGGKIRDLWFDQSIRNCSKILYGM